MDDVTLGTILNACSHSGNIEMALKIFENIKKPNKKHCGIIVDALVRNGFLEEGEMLAKKWLGTD